MTTTYQPSTRPGRSAPVAVSVAAWAVPVMIVGQFALLAIVPVAVVLVGALRHARDRLVRWAAVLVALAYAVPFAVWVARPDGAPSLSKDMHPAFAVLIVAACAALVVAVVRAGRR
ncbi:hypothetical protein ACNF49_32455 [Actinomadura sp. ATCC 39365]|uniref:hypothetical protein n=1 Tax=Nonomuraea sp. NPDC005692 TaxID=3157168 RepID=UPI0033C9CED9